MLINPKTELSIWDYLTHCSLFKLLKVGSKRQLTFEDVGQPVPRDKAEILYGKFEVAWEKELQKPIKKRSLLKAIFAATERKKFYFGVFCMFLAFILQFGPIIGMNILVKHFEGTDVLTTREQLLTAAFMAICSFVVSFMHGINYRIAAEFVMQLRSVSSMAIFHKSLKLSAMGKGLSSIGQIQNLVAKDTESFFYFFFDFGFSVMTPLTIIVGIVSIYSLVGWSVFVGVALFVIVLPISAKLFGKSNILMLDLQKYVDGRLKSSNEVFTGMKIIKLYCWEKPFQKVITSIRNKELKVLQSFAFLMAWGMCVGLIAVPVLQPLVVFITYVKSGHDLTASKAFTTIALFNLIKLPFTILPMWIGSYSMMRSALLRMHQFMARDTVDDLVLEDKNVDDENENENKLDDENAIEVKNCDFTWKHEPTEYVKYFDKWLHREEEKTENGKENDDKKNKTKDETSESGSDDTDAIEIQITDNESEKSDSDSTSTSTTTTTATKEPLFDLNNITFDVKKGELLAIIGGVGSGKSSLLQAIMGEMKRTSGTLKAEGTVAYLPQQAWILNDTVSGNITLGNLKEDDDSDSERLKATVDACALRTDISELSGGLLCEIGSRGVNLSGGQRARINLARCVYSDADIYLLDDPISAVDSHVGTHIFNECICGYLDGKTRVLVTNALHFLQKADRVLVLDKGQIVACGNYNDILKAADKSKLVKHLLNEITQKESHDENESGDEENEDGDDDENNKEKQRMRAESLHEDEDAGKLVEEEQRLSGAVTWKLYKFYIQNCGIKFVSAIIILFFISRLIENGSVFWLSAWSNDVEDAGDEGLSSSETDGWLFGYGTITFTAVVAYLGAYALMAKARVVASKRIHETMIERVVRAPMSFFDKTPIGRITNRFSRDMDVVDTSLPNILSDFVFASVQAIGQLFAVIVASKGIMAVPMAPLTYGFYIVQKYFRASNTEVTRLQSVSRSPFFNCFNECLEGTSSIRAHKLESLFISRIHKLLDKTIRCQLVGFFLDVWLHFYLSILSGFLLLSLVLVVISLSDYLSAGLIGISLVYVNDCIVYLAHATMLSAKSESQMNAIERLADFCKLPSEAPAEIEDKKPEKSWPNAGKIEIENLVMGYADGPDILHEVSAVIKAGEKIGVVGRTGAGKSSLMVALFRLEEPRAGAVMIDGIDISKIGLDDVRSKLAIIPQEPVMFSGTVRMNVDPFSQCTDDDIWLALEKARLKEVVQELPLNLEDIVSENGGNFSVGQRQLFCLVRALLRKPKVLMMDEATGSVDAETDFVIQTMIREQFQDCTVITIAHRLETIIDSDRILVLDKGNIIEFDAPKTLLENEESYFLGMIKSTGDSNAQKLRIRAIEAFKK